MARPAEAVLVGDPPRRLAAGQGRAVLLGHPLSLLGALALTLATSLLWFFVAAYGIQFSTLRPLLGPRLEAAAQVESSGEVRLATGEAAFRTTAVFSHQGATYRAAAYGTPASPLAPGQPVTVLMPAGAPEAAWIAGLQKYPLRLSGLSSMARVILLPGLLLLLWGLLAGASQWRRLRWGTGVTGRRTHHWRLARPLSDRYLDRFTYKDETGRAGSVWCVSPDGPEQEVVLLNRLGATVLKSVLPRIESGEDGLGGVSTGRRIVAWLVLLLGLSQLGLLLLFLAT